MNKESYKEQLGSLISECAKSEKEINRLWILVAEYSDKDNQLKRLVKDNPNNMELGKKIRELHLEDKTERTDENQMSLFNGE